MSRNSTIAGTTTALSGTTTAESGALSGRVGSQLFASPWTPIVTKMVPSIGTTLTTDNMDRCLGMGEIITNVAFVGAKRTLLHRVDTLVVMLGG